MSNGVLSYTSMLVRALINPGRVNEDGRHRGSVTATLTLASLFGFALAYQYVIPRVDGPLPVFGWTGITGAETLGFDAALFGRGLAVAAVVFTSYFLLNVVVAIIAANPQRRQFPDYIGAASVAMVPVLCGVALAAVFINMNDYAAGLIFLGLLAGAFVHHHAQVVCFGLWRPLAVYLTPALYLLQLYALHRLTI